MEIKLKQKYRTERPISGGRRSNYNGNSGTSNGKHTPHPDVHGFRTRGYRCEPKWNPRPAEQPL
jgi:hypothetical protein